MVSLCRLASRNSRTERIRRHAGTVALRLLILALFAHGQGARASADSSEPDGDQVELETLRTYEDPEQRNAHFEQGPLQDQLGPLETFKEALSERHGFDFLLTYSVVSQYGSEDDRRFTAAHEVDLVGEWRLLQSPRFGSGRIQFQLCHLLTLTGVDTTEFGRSLGSSWGTNDYDTHPDDDDYAIAFLWWEQRFLEDRAQVLVGKLDPRELVARNRYFGDGQEGFFAAPLAADPTLAFLDTAGLGALASFTGESWRAIAMVNDATAERGSIDFDSVGDGEWQWAGELAWTPHLPALGEGNYRATVFHVPRVGRGEEEKSDWSWALSFDQDLGDRFGVFLYFSRAHRRVADLKHNLSAGIVFKEPLGWRHDEIGLSLTWGKPNAGDARNQLGVEAYWRLQLTDRIELTPDLQLLIRPATKGNELEAVGGLRMRIFL